MSDSQKSETAPQPYEEATDESDTPEDEALSWEDLKEGDEETLKDWLLPETGEVEGIE